MEDKEKTKTDKKRLEKRRTIGEREKREALVEKMNPCFGNKYSKGKTMKKLEKSNTNINNEMECACQQGLGTWSGSAGVQWSRWSRLHTKVYLQGKVEEQMASLNKDLEDISGVFIIKIINCDM